MESSATRKSAARGQQVQQVPVEQGYTPAQQVLVQPQPMVLVPHQYPAVQAIPVQQPSPVITSVASPPQQMIAPSQPEMPPPQLVMAPKQQVMVPVVFYQPRYPPQPIQNTYVQ